MQRSLVLGVDAGSANVAAALAALAEGEPQVIGIGVVPSSGIRKGVVADLHAASGCIREAVAKAAAMAGIDPGEAAAAHTMVSVSGAHIRSVVGAGEVAVQKPAAGVSPADVRRVLEQAAAVELPVDHSVLHVVPRAYRLDGSEGIPDPVGLAGRKLSAEAHLVSGDRLSVQNHLNAVSMAGLNAADCLAGIRVVGDSVLTPDERDDGVLLLDFGAETTSLAMYEDGHLWHVAVVPIGGEHITADIAAIMRIPLASAERLKAERGWAAVELCPDSQFELVSPSGRKVQEVTDKQLAAIVESRVQETLQLVAEQVKSSGYTGLFRRGLVLTGGGSRLNGLAAVAADCLGLKARIGAAGDVLVSEPELGTVAALVGWGARQVAEEAAARADEAKRDKWGRVTNWLRGLFR